MSRKTSTRPSASPVSAPAAKPAAKSKAKTYEAFPKPSKPAALAKGLTKPETPAKAETARPAAPPKPAATPAPKAEVAPAPKAEPAPAPRVNEAQNQVLTRAERDITSAIDSLNNQMNAALTALAQLASAHTDHGKAVVRTAPLDRATATFQRLVAEVVDDQLTEMLPPLIALRNENAQWAAGDAKDSPEADFHNRNVQTLDHVLTLTGVTSFDARPGQPFDPLIHLAVGELHRDDLADGAVAECFQAGFRSSRGKVLAQARVRINRR